MGFETAKEAHLGSGTALRAGSRGLPNSQLGDPGSGPTGPGRGPWERGQVQNLEAVGETARSFDKVHLLSAHCVSGAVLGAGAVPALRPSWSLPRWAGVEGAGREHGQHCQERASRGQPDWSGDMR